jgi:dTDP-4-amino-4,6-dideoxygalactose transaminase
MAKPTGTSSTWPKFTEEEANAISRVLLSNKVNYWTGDEGRHFEQEFAAFACTDHAIALANGTVALDLALHGLGIGARNGGSASDEVVVTPRSFIASVSCVVNAGARPVFADVDFKTGNIAPASVEPLITDFTKAIICVHHSGWPCDMDGFSALVQGRSISLIEDCAQAHGARYKGRAVGSLGDVAAWSFCQDKIMTTGGEGGMVTTNSKQLWSKMWAFKDHGKDWSAVYERRHPPGFRWVHESVGTNWRMTEMQAAIGRIQLKRMSNWHNQRSKNAERLTQILTPFADPTRGLIRLPEHQCPFCCCRPEASQGCEHAWYKFYAYVRPENLPKGHSRDSIVSTFNQAGLRCFHGGCSEIYREDAFNELELKPLVPLANARSLGESSLMFEVHPGAKIDRLPEDLFDQA